MGIDGFDGDLEGGWRWYIMFEDFWRVFEWKGKKGGMERIGWEMMFYVGKDMHG